VAKQPAFHPVLLTVLSPSLDKAEDCLSEEFLDDWAGRGEELCLGEVEERCPQLLLDLGESADAGGVLGAAFEETEEVLGVLGEDGDGCC
jgi:hypothetical protein